MLKHAKRIVALEKVLAAGIGGVLAQHVRWFLGTYTTAIYSVIAGFGGRPITRPSLLRLLERAVRDQLELTHFLDLRRLPENGIPDCAGFSFVIKARQQAHSRTMERLSQHGGRTKRQTGWYAIFQKSP